MAGELELNSESGIEQKRNLERYLIHPGMRELKNKTKKRNNVIKYLGQE